MDLSEYPEKYWHFLIQKESQEYPAIINDLDKITLCKKVIEPWLAKRTFTVDSTIIERNFHEIKNIQLVLTKQTLKFYESIYNRRMTQNNNYTIESDTRMLPFCKEFCIDYTNELLYPATDEVKPLTPKITKKVFIVHGHDEHAREAVARLINEQGLKSIILHEQANSGQTIIEKFEKESEDTAFAVILLTPDDFGGSQKSPNIQNARARQNVILELGYFIGKLGRNRVCALRKGNIENPSDYSGVLYIDMDSSDSWKYKLAKEMKNAGLSVDLNKI